VLALAPLVGCEGLGQVKVEIPDYASADVRGIKLWKQDATTGGFVPQTVYEFGKIISQDGVEYVSYTVQDDRYQLDVPLAGVVVRDPDRPESLTVELAVVTAGEFATVRASAFNDIGESALSEQTAEIGL
jgi:hypothetical protein